jgi:1-acyl-sn-glycerol-3-phosphate acyltransferase
VIGAALLPARTAAFVGLTFGMYGLLEVDTALSAAGEREVVLAKWIARYGRALLRLYGVELRAGGPYAGEGRRYPGRGAAGRGRIFVMNHRSGLDVPVTLALFDATIVSRADLADWPVIGMAARRVGTLFVDRESRSSGAAVVHGMVQAIEAGRSVMIYPEGTTYAGDEVRPFRTGAFRTAVRSGAEVVPAGIAYRDRAEFTEDSFVRHMRRVSERPRTHVAVEVGEPITQLPDESPEALRDRAQEAVQALVHRARARLTG